MCVSQCLITLHCLHNIHTHYAISIHWTWRKKRLGFHSNFIFRFSLKYIHYIYYIYIHFNKINQKECDKKVFEGLLINYNSLVKLCNYRCFIFYIFFFFKGRYRNIYNLAWTRYFYTLAKMGYLTLSIIGWNRKKNILFSFQGSFQQQN